MCAITSSRRSGLIGSGSITSSLPFCRAQETHHHADQAAALLNAHLGV